MARVTKLNVNGSSRTIDADADISLLSVLRDQLDLTGSKYGCGEGQCGACTVLVDGNPRRSCITPVGAVGQKQITTIEGLAQGDSLHPLQKAFLEEAAMQCAYCTSGMIMTAVSLLRANPNPSAYRGCNPKGGEGHEPFHEGVRPMSDKPDFQIPLEPQRYELTAPPAYRFEVDRREFFKFFGAGILIVGVLKNAHALQESGDVRRTDESLPKEIGVWLPLGENDAVTVYTGKVEVGQNIRTSLSQCVAEELHVPVNRIQMVMGDTQLTPFDMGTFGSRTTPTMSPQLRKVAAAARDLLIGLAAAEWQTDRKRLITVDGRVT